MGELYNSHHISLFNFSIQFKIGEVVYMKKGIFIGFVAGVITTILAIFLVCLVSFFLENAWFFYDVEPIPAPDMPIIYPDGTVYARM